MPKLNNKELLKYIQEWEDRDAEFPEDEADRDEEHYEEEYFLNYIQQQLNKTNKNENKD